MQIGLFFGSFNPVHHGHLIIANYIAQQTELQQVWFVVSPQNPLKPADGLLNEYHRLYLLQIATENEAQLKVIDIEFKLPRPSFTADTLAYLHEKYPQHQFALILGSDSYQNLPRWKNVAYIFNNHKIYVYPRPGHEVGAIYPGSQTLVVKAPLLEISATHIRENIRSGKSIRYLVPDKVMNEILNNGYYKI